MPISQDEKEKAVKTLQNAARGLFAKNAVARKKTAETKSLEIDEIKIQIKSPSV